MKFPAYLCKHFESGLAKPHCRRPGADHYDYCGGECEHWINNKGQTHEQVLERIVYGSDKK